MCRSGRPALTGFRALAAVLAGLLDAGLTDAVYPAGDAACWANLVCPECGAVVTEGRRPRCQAGSSPG
jgi:hypothetical protein